MSRELSRIQKLAWRVGWLDRHRRMIAVLCGVLVWPLLIRRITDALGVDWSQFHSTALAAMLSLGVWCVIEIGLIWLTALWETECAGLMRDGGLPRAIVRKG